MHLYKHGARSAHGGFVCGWDIRADVVIRSTWQCQTDAKGRSVLHPKASFTLATGCHQQGREPARALACVPVHEQVYELLPFWLAKRGFC